MDLHFLWPVSGFPGVFLIQALSKSLSQLRAFCQHREPSATRLLHSTHCCDALPSAFHHLIIS